MQLDIEPTTYREISAKCCLTEIIFRQNLTELLMKIFSKRDKIKFHVRIIDQPENSMGF